MQAFRDILYLEHDVPFGKLLRNMHRWAAHLMVITVWLHMFRVFLTGSYKKPREFNWCVGVLLLVLTLLLSFTGYLLPDDQLGFWAVTVGTNMARATPLLGHEGPFGAQLGMTPYNDVRFAPAGRLDRGRERAAARLHLALHRAFRSSRRLFMVVHFWRVRKDGGISGPAPVMLESEIKEAEEVRTIDDRERRATAADVTRRTETSRHDSGTYGLASTLGNRSAPDNVPIVVLLFLVPFYIWYGVAAGARQRPADRATRSRSRSWPRRTIARPSPGKPGWAQEVHVWPYLLRIEFLAAIIVTVILMVWSITLNAPLEEPANPNLTMNPSKARGTSWACRRCWSISIRGSPAW